MLITIFWGGIFYLFDIPSFIVVFGISIPLFGITGLWNDFRRAIKIAYSKENLYEIYELKKSLLAIKAFQVLLIFSGLYGTIIGFIGILQGDYRPNNFLPLISVSLITLFYSITAILLMIPISYRIKSLILDKEEESK